MMSGGLNKLSAVSQSSFARMSSHSDQLVNKNRVLGMSYDQIQQKIKSVEHTIKTSTIPSQIAAARTELQKLQSMASRHMGNISPSSSGSSSGGIGIGGVAVGSMLGGMAGGAIMGMASKTGAMISAGISEGITKSMQKEQAIVGLTTFLGKAGAEEAYANIRKDADATPFNTESLLSANRLLISSGVDAKNARKDVMNLANAVTAVGGGNDELSRMAANLQQIKTVGKATAMDIRQFGMTGINIYEMLAKATGKSVEQLKEMDVTYDQLAKAMELANSKGGMYEGALAAQSMTRAGRWNTVEDKFGNALIDIADRFAPLIDRVLNTVVAIADNIGGWLDQASPFIDALNEGLGGAWDFVSEIGALIGDIAGPILQWAMHSQMIKDTFYWIMVFAKMYGDEIKYTLNLLKLMFEKFILPALMVMEKFHQYTKIGGKKDDPDGWSGGVAHIPKSQDKFDLKSLMSGNAAAGKAAGETVTGGGPKNVTINVGKFMDALHFHTLNSKESAQELEKMIMELFARVVYNGAKLV